jgi:predicted O-methyltransferase YrrM
MKYIFVILIISSILILLSTNSLKEKFKSKNKINLKYSKNFTDRHTKNWLSVTKKFIKNPNVKMLELGTYEARSSKFFIDNILTGKNSELVTVDFKPDITKYSLSNINQMEDYYPNFNFIRADFKKFLAEEISLDRKYDIIYQDGGKLSLTTMYQLICCYYLLNSGGVLIIDDYEWVNKNKSKNNKLNNNDGPKEAVDTFIKFVNNDITLLHKGYQLILKKN